MVPPTGPLNLDVEAISGICGSISIACWVVVFSPQIIENFRRKSADGLSLQFIIVWLAGDVFNILGAVLQGVLPTMIILAVYYTIADIVLLGQCFYYRGFTWRDDVVPSKPKHKKQRAVNSAGGSSSSSSSTRNGRPDERTSLLAKNTANNRLIGSVEENGHASGHHHHHHHQERRGSNWSTLSPAMPFVPDLANLDGAAEHTAHHHHNQHTSTTNAAATTNTSSSPSQTASTLQTVIFNAMSMLMVCAAGVAGWYLSGGSNRDDNSSPPSDGGNDNSDLTFNFWGQVFGYFCAIFYLGSRVPQLLLNWRRQSTEGVSMLFFLFACLGNLTYVLSIFAYDGCSGQNRATCTPEDARARYGRYLLVNLSWLAGSLGTLFLDMCIFVQFFIYRVEGADDDEYSEDGEYDEEEGSCDTDVDVDENVDEDSDEERDQRPLLRRNMSSYHA
ncbi:putative vacuolar membrane transporter for cationic amino acids [Sporothrix stenoceras]|uniref:Vacuolar membrane transporter for cationic amino acids n=1 Tax=Sporothrix stenoceras TaxID=5173 RepID=A0ABR3YXR3_9PEZI